MNELLTVKARADELLGKNPTLVFAVLVNRDLNQVSFEQRAQAGDPKNPVTQTVPYVPAAEFARLLGFEGIRVDRPEDVVPAWERALAADKPVILEFVTDPQIVPLPPHVRFEQMKKTTKALASGDEDAVGDRHEGFQGQARRGQGTSSRSRIVTALELTDHRGHHAPVHRSDRAARGGRHAGVGLTHRPADHSHRRWCDRSRVHLHAIGSGRCGEWQAGRRHHRSRRP